MKQRAIFQFERFAFKFKRCYSIWTGLKSKDFTTNMTQLSLAESKTMLFRYMRILFPSGIKFENCQIEGWRRERGWRSGESARLPRMCSGFDSRIRRHMWIEFVVGSLLCSERLFSGYSVFPSHQKPTFLISNSILECTENSERVIVNSLVLRGKTNYFLP